MAKEEAERAAAFKARMDALQNFSKNYESRVGARLQEARQEEDNKVNAALIEAERKRVEKEDRERAQKKAALIASTEYNIRMMEEKQRRKDQVKIAGLPLDVKRRISIVGQIATIIMVNCEQDRLDAMERRRKLEQEALEQKRQEREANERKRIQMMEMKQQLDRCAYYRRP